MQRDAAYFDQWYADIGASPVRNSLFADSLGLPPEIEPSSGVPLTGLTEIAELLRLDPSATLLDLACGRGGPGMWIARRTGCRLVGIDLSPVAVAAAMSRRELFGPADRAHFSVGSLDVLDLPEAEYDAAVCVDGIQFAADVTATLTSVRGGLRAGGRLALTCWEARDAAGDEVPERLRLDLAQCCAAAGFTDIEVAERPAWHEAMRRMWEATLATPVGGDPALESMHAEAERSIRTHDQVRRVLVTAGA